MRLRKRASLLAAAAMCLAAVPMQAHAWGEWSDCFDGGITDGNIWTKQPLVSGAEIWVGMEAGAKATDLPPIDAYDYMSGGLGYCIGLVQNGTWTTGVKVWVLSNAPTTPVGTGQDFVIWRVIGCTDCPNADYYDVLLDWTGYETRTSKTCSTSGTGACTASNFHWEDGVRTAVPLAEYNTGVEFIPSLFIGTSAPYKVRLGTVKDWIDGSAAPTPICVTLLPAGTCTS